MSSNPLSKNYTFASLMKFTLPTIVLIMFTSLYTMVDGVFVSRMIGTSALSAVNIVYPVTNFFMGVGIMLGTGASAAIAKKMGEGKREEAKENFSFICIVSLAAGVAIAVIGLVALKPLLYLLGANDAIYGYCRDYAFPLFFFIPAALVLNIFQYLFVTAGKPALGLATTIAGGLANIVLDYLLIGPLRMGIAGAAVATGIGYSIPALFGLIYFACNKKGTLYLVRPKFDGRVLFASCANGSSEMVTNLSVAVTTMMFNIIMMDMLGEKGVAAITIILYSQFFLMSVYLGYSSGVAPIFSYNYGFKDQVQLKKLFRISIGFISISSVLMCGLAMLLARGIVGVFTPPGDKVYQLAVDGFYLFSLSYLFMGINVFASSLFTALSNGKVSAILSFLRTFVLLICFILVLPRIIGVPGIWLAVPAAELLSIAISLYYIIKLRKVYHYA